MSHFLVAGGTGDGEDFLGAVMKISAACYDTGEQVELGSSASVPVPRVGEFILWPDNTHWVVKQVCYCHSSGTIILNCYVPVNADIVALMVNSHFSQRGGG